MVAAAATGCGSGPDGDANQSEVVPQSSAASVAMDGECRWLTAFDVTSMVGGGMLTAARDQPAGCMWEVDGGSAGVSADRSKSKQGYADAKARTPTIDFAGGTIHLLDMSDPSMCGGYVIADSAPTDEFLKLSIVATTEGTAAMTREAGMSVCSNAVPQVQKVLRELGWAR
ncbi:hypothetical protein GCM10009624_20010 [Gordonia sinesedis]